jgi:uncharacterized protein
MIVDVNVNLSRWPFRRVVGDDTPSLVASLKERGVAQAWAGSFDGMLYKDIGGVNARLAEACRTHGRDFLVPFGSVNPKLPDWQEDLRRCHEDYRMPGIRLQPNYHGYDLHDPAFRELIQLATARRLIVQIALCMEDERTQHPLLHVPNVDCGPLLDLLKSTPGPRLVMINCGPAIRDDLLQPILAAGDAYCDISMVESVAGVARLTERVSPQKVLFGSYYPFFYFESALFKMRESGLPDSVKTEIEEGNARRLLKSVAG